MESASTLSCSAIISFIFSNIVSISFLNEFSFCDRKNAITVLIFYQKME